MYLRDTLISRRGYGGLGGTLSDIGGAIKDVASGALTFYGNTQQAAGAAQAQAQANRDLTAALSSQGPGLGTVLLVGGAGLAAFLLLRKKKSA